MLRLRRQPPSRTRYLVALAALALALSLLPGAATTTNAMQFAAPGFSSELVLSTATSPVTLRNLTAFAFTPTGDKLFIAHKYGRVSVATRNGDGSYSVRSQSFVNIDYQTNLASDRGLLSIAVDPQWPTRPYLYLLFTYDPPEIQANPAGASGPDGSGARVARLIRVTANADLEYNRAVMLPSPPNPANRPVEVVLLGNNSTYANIGNPGAINVGTAPSCESGGVYVVDCLPMDSSSHTIGQVQFGSDGKLWVSNGDGAEFAYVDPKALRVQSLDSLAGKIMRIDPDTGLGLADNPFYNGDPASNRSRVVSYGLRNPFRFTLAPGASGQIDELFTGDVGWNVWEEINRGSGKNFGWPCYEGNSYGNAQQPAYRDSSLTSAACADVYANAVNITAPLYSYEQISNDGAGLAGAFYRGTSYPEAYQGALFVIDYALNRFEYLTFDEQGAATAHPFASSVASGGAPVQLTPGPDGDLYYVVLAGDNSEIRRIRYTSGNLPPTPVIGATPTSGQAPLNVALSAAGTADPEGNPIASYSWSFGDGATGSGLTTSHTYTATGTFTVTLEVADSLGAIGTAQRTITVGNTAPTVQITAPVSGTLYVVDQDQIAFSATISDPEETLAAGQISWAGILHHDGHTHTDTPITLNADRRGGTIAPEDHSDQTWVELCVTATDSGGLSATDCIELRPRKVAYTFVSDPPGLAVVYEGVARIAPFTMQANQNAQQQIIAAPYQGARRFAFWRDGQSLLTTSSLTVRIGASPQTYTVRYDTPVFLTRVTR